MDTKNTNPPKRLVALDNRYGYTNFLNQINDSEYSVELCKEGGDLLRVGFNEDNSIYFIDPPGGPFLSIGSEVFGIKGKISEIKQVNNTYLLKFK